MFKQMFDQNSSTLTYLLADEERKEAVMIDPVDQHIDDYLTLIKQHDLKLMYVLETHVHADHITAGGQLRSALDAQTAVSQRCGAVCADVQLNDGDEVSFGNEVIKVIATPGHTAGSLSFLWRDRLFTGDTLLINGCGRTDFQSGDAGALFDSITNKIFTLPDETLVYPGHDYRGYRVSSVGQEKGINPRLANQSREAFIQLMQALDLPKPKLIDIAVPANQLCGVEKTTVIQG